MSDMSDRSQSHAGNGTHGLNGGAVSIMPVFGLPEVFVDDDLAALVAERLAHAGVGLRARDVVVVAQKVVSKAEGAVVSLAGGESVHEARVRLARKLATRVVVDVPGVLVVRTHHGLVCANAGIDASNAASGTLIVLPDDPDASARRLRRRLVELTGADVAVVITDTFGRAWRTGQTDVAIGLAGMACIRDERTGVDRAGRPLEVTRIAVADEVAAAADLVRRKAQGVPVVVIRGLDWDPDPDAKAAQLVRDVAEDLFPRGRGQLGAALLEPEALRPVDMPTVRQAVRTVSTVVGDGVWFDIDSVSNPLLVRPRWVVAHEQAGHERELAAAGALVYAVLVDAGNAAELRLGPEPAVLIHQSTVVDGEQ